MARLPAVANAVSVLPWYSYKALHRRRAIVQKSPAGWT
jgi:hypothetical protein